MPALLSPDPGWSRTKAWSSWIIQLFALAAILLVHPSLALDCSYDLTAFDNDTICAFDVDLISPESSEVYSHCRIILGYVAIQYIDLHAIPPISFPNLEVIRDFLLIHRVSASEPSNPPNQIFPRLRQILGHRRLYNTTVHISFFDEHQDIGLVNLDKVCGPIQIENSTVCFRHTDAYWRIATHYVDKQNKMSFKALNSKDVLLHQLKPQNGIEAKLKVHYRGKPNNRNDTMLFVIFDVDSSYFNYLQNGTRPPSETCPHKLKKHEMFLISNLVHSDKAEYKTIQGHLDFHSSQPLIEIQKNLISTFVTTVQPGNQTWNRYYDIKKINHVRSVRDHSYFVMSEPYLFRWSHTYLIKVEYCPDSTHESCTFQYFLTYKPNVKDFTDFEIQKQSHKTATWAIVLLMVTIIVSVAVGLLANRKSLLRLFIQYRLKSLSRVEVISVNPEYSLVNSLNLSEVWSSWSPFSKDSSSFENVSCEINRSMLTILPNQLLGNGEFGMVHKGQLRYGFEANGCDPGQNHQNGNPNGNLMLVAIKQLKDNARQIDKERFIVEAKYMKTFNSNFLVKLIGICTVDEPILVVMEFMENGDLKHFLREKYLLYRDTHNLNVLPSRDCLIQMAIQIGDGMHYLHSKKIIHRDLAARNCMVTIDLTVKIGDFGLTRLLYERDYYRLSEEAPMPLRWMAPESVRKMIFTPASDVWSYGVLLWEIMSFGEQPYKGKTDLEVKQMIVNCTKLKPPTYYIPVMWDIAKLCWRKNSTLRPSFKQIIETIYPHLGQNQCQFDQLSFYIADRDCVHRHNSSSSGSSGSGCSHHPHCTNPNPHQQRCSFSNLRQYFGWMCGRSSRADNRHGRNGSNGCPCYHRQLTNSSIQSSHSQCSSSVNDRAHSCRHNHPHRNRCLSIDSIQSADCSEITTITSISTN